MKTIILTLLISVSTVACANDPMANAVAFNRWYISQVSRDVFPITEGHQIDKYVTADTLKKLRHAQDPRYSDDGFYEADFFLKAQYIGDDWASNVKVVSGDTDPICVNVFIKFGKTHPHTVIDCMVREGGTWKIQSVTNRD
jgi:Protein of unknown function (DUF3828)